MKIVLENERPMSWNRFMRLHWTTKDDEVKRVNMLVRSLIGDYTMIAHRVDLIVTAYFKSKPQDCSNICAKLYEDGLKGIVIKDDNIRYVRSVKTISNIDKENPRVEIEII